MLLPVLYVDVLLRIIMLRFFMSHPDHIAGTTAYFLLFSLLLLSISFLFYTPFLVLLSAVRTAGPDT